MSHSSVPQHAFIIGGGNGIALSCAAVFLADRAKVTIVGRNNEKLAAAAKLLAHEHRRS